MHNRQVAETVNARVLVTADHGNADDMVQRDKKGKPLVGAERRVLSGIVLSAEWGSFRMGRA